MFPTGMAGIGLLILRFSMAALLVDVAVHSPFTTSFWALLAIASPAVAPCLGLATPYASTIICLIEPVAILRYGGQYVVNLITSGVDTADLENAESRRICSTRGFSTDESSVSKFEAKLMTSNDHFSFHKKCGPQAMPLAVNGSTACFSKQ